MKPKIIFCLAVSGATLAVILLALLSPSVHRKPQRSQTRPWLALSLYIQHPHHPNPNNQLGPLTNGALIFHQTITVGPENTSRAIGKAQGFIIPIEHFAHSAFNIIYLTIHTDEYSGALSVQATPVGHKHREVLTVLGGTGSFAFAQGLAIFTRIDGSQPLDVVNAIYWVKLRLRFPYQAQTIPG